MNSSEEKLPGTEISDGASCRQINSPALSEMKTESGSDTAIISGTAKNGFFRVGAWGQLLLLMIAGSLISLPGSLVAAIHTAAEESVPDAESEESEREETEREEVAKRREKETTREFQSRRAQRRPVDPQVQFTLRLAGGTRFADDDSRAEHNGYGGHLIL